MGPYCKFCGERCFIPTKKSDYVTKDLKATCTKGILFDMDSTFPKLFDSKQKQIGWILDLKRHNSEYSLAAEILNNSVMEFEIRNIELEQVIDFTKSPKDNTYYRLVK
jgi:hypothetical protein